MQVVADNSRYNAYQLVDAALMGDLARTHKMLNGLQAENVYPLLSFGAVTRELRTLQPMVEKRENGQPLTAIMQTARIFFNRKQTVRTAISRLSVPSWGAAGAGSSGRSGLQGHEPGQPLG